MTRTQAIATRPGQLQAPFLNYFLVDGSTSMAGQWSDLMAALDAFKDTMMAQNSHSHGIVQVFGGTDLSLIERDGLINEWPSFTRERLYMPGGATPLYDAINLMCRSLRDLDPPKCHICIGTDGDSNGKQVTDLTQARAMLNWCRAKGWQITFLGFDINNDSIAASLGSDLSNTLGVQRKLLSDAGKKLAEKAAAFGAGADDVSFTDSERSTFGGYLGAPGK